MAKHTLLPMLLASWLRNHRNFRTKYAMADGAELVMRTLSVCVKILPVSTFSVIVVVTSADTENMPSKPDQVHSMTTQSFSVIVSELTRVM